MQLFCCPWATISRLSPNLKQHGPSYLRLATHSILHRSRTWIRGKWFVLGRTLRSQSERDAELVWKDSIASVGWFFKENPSLKKEAAKTQQKEAGRNLQTTQTDVMHMTSEYANYVFARLAQAEMGPHIGKAFVPKSAASVKVPH